MDIDGVLCQDPSVEQNDDGPKYRDFLRTARSLWQPSATIGMLVTSRLEKYRDLTEIWLAKQGIKYQCLVMMQYSTMVERQKAKAYGTFKAEVYAHSDNILFIESSDEIAKEIAKKSGKPALCIESHCIYDPFGFPLIKQRFKKVVHNASSFKTLKKRVFRKLRKIISSLGHYFLGITSRSN